MIKNKSHIHMHAHTRMRAHAGILLSGGGGGRNSVVCGNVNGNGDHCVEKNNKTKQKTSLEYRKTMPWSFTCRTSEVDLLQVSRRRISVNRERWKW